MSEISQGNRSAANDSEPRPAFAPGRRTLTIMDAIYSRRAVRQFTGAKVPETAIHALLYAAVQAPTLAKETAALGFSIIGDRQILGELSEWTGRLYNAVEGEALLPHPAGSNDLDFFHGGGLLMVIYDLSGDERHLPECWMAAENVMLAACGMGLGTCLIAPVVAALNRPEWKIRLEAPKAALAVCAIVLGTPEGPLSAVSRFPPEVFSWLS
ncbi:MAG: nitroreductase family protein [Asticcacaulis sp.]|nr:nitroreductase family protein [Asticcacaulis sp.]